MLLSLKLVSNQARLTKTYDVLTLIKDKLIFIFFIPSFHFVSFRKAVTSVQIYGTGYFFLSFLSFLQASLFNTSCKWFESQLKSLLFRLSVAEDC